jgi:hypothetical protein
VPDKGPNFFGYEDARNWQWHEEGEPPLLRHFEVSTLEEYEALFAGVTDERAVGEVSPSISGARPPRAESTRSSRRQAGREPQEPG